LAAKWKVGILDNEGRSYGWGFGKFEPLFKEHHERFLVLDSDTVITGPIIDVLGKMQGDFIVDKEDTPLEKMNRLYFNVEKLKHLFTDFKFQNFVFNTGQWVGTSGLIRKTDFDPLLSWTGERPQLKFNDVFFQADQGIFNYVLQDKSSKGEVELCRHHFMVWPSNDAADSIDINSIKGKKGDYPFVIHWAGMKFSTLSKYPRADILKFYQGVYYQNHSIVEKSLDVFIDVFLRVERKCRKLLKRSI
jgi:lipopolysaccharide biosynthesis glycosyltransferase